MKKALIPVLVLLLACNSNHQQADPSPNDLPGQPSSGSLSNQPETTSTNNNNAYNTTDTGASRGSIMDSSAGHTMSNRKDSAR